MDVLKKLHIPSGLGAPHYLRRICEAGDLKHPALALLTQQLKGREQIYSKMQSNKKYEEENRLRKPLSIHRHLSSTAIYKKQH